MISSLYGRDGGLEGDTSFSTGGMWFSIIKAGAEIDIAGVSFSRAFVRRGDGISSWNDR